MITRRLIVTCALALPLLAGAGSNGPADETYVRTADLKKLEEWVSLEQSFTNAARLDAQRVIAEHRKNASEFSEAEFYMEVRRIVGLADNGHSNVTNAPIRDTFGLVPLSTYWFSDGVYVVRAPNPHGLLLGARIDAINGRTVADLEALLMKYSSGTAEYFRRYTSPLLMFSPAVLHAIGLSDRPDRLELRLTSRAGERLEVELEVDRDSSGAGEYPWRYLHPAPIEEYKGWSTIHDTSATLPLYLQEEEQLFRYELLDGGAIAYIQLRSNQGPDGNSIRDFLTRTRKRLERDRPHSIILDNRQNPGGDLGLTADFGLALPSLAKPDGRVYVITGNATFSAGIYCSFYPEAADPERTIIVGERVGDQARIWSETGAPFRLPDSGYYIGYSLRMHDPGAGCHDREKCHLARGSFPARWNIAVGSLEPEWPVSTSFADFEAGHDRPLERILAAVAEQRATARD